MRKTIGSILSWILLVVVCLGLLATVAFACYWKVKIHQQVAEASALSTVEQKEDDSSKEVRVSLDIGVSFVCEKHFQVREYDNESGKSAEVSEKSSDNPILILSVLNSESLAREYAESVRKNAVAAGIDSSPVAKASAPLGDGYTVTTKSSSQTGGGRITRSFYANLGKGEILWVFSSVDVDVEEEPGEDAFAVWQKCIQTLKSREGK